MDKIASHNNRISTKFFKLTNTVSFKELIIPVIRHDAVNLLIGSDFEELLNFTDVRHRKVINIWMAASRKHRM